MTTAPPRVRALICEDEPLAVRAVRAYLGEVDWIEVVGEANDGKEALRLIHRQEPDLVFLDVRMPEMTGVEVLEALSHRPAVVFTTAHEEYALPAFEWGAVDYLVKPFGRERFLETLDRVRVRLVGEGLAPWDGSPRRGTHGGGAGGPYLRRLFAERGGAMIPVSARDIVRIDAATPGAYLQTSGGRFAVPYNLTELEARLDPSDFVRAHRSHIVNLSHVVSIRRYDERRLTIRLDDDSTVVASRRGSAALRERME